MKRNKIVINCAMVILLVNVLVFFPGHTVSQQYTRRIITDTDVLKQTVISFMAKTDSDKYAEIIPYYDTNFLSIRVVDAGQFIKMDYKQMVYFWKMQSDKQAERNTLHRQAIVTQKTTIHYIEILGDTGYVLLTRIKDLGSGFEPMFYNLIWTRKNNKWYLLREIVHQRTMPSFH